MTAVKHPERIPPGVPLSMVHDFNREADPDFARDPWAVLDRLRREAPPLFFSTDHPETDKGAWYVANEAIMREMLQTPAVFTTQEGVSVGLAPWPRKIIPLEVDPPDHLKFRAILGPIFSPRTIDRWDARVREVTGALIDQIAATGECEFLDAVAKPLPSTILVEIMGLPTERRAEFVGWVEEMFHGERPESRRAAGVRSMEYLKTVIAERYAAPGDDAVSIVCRAQVDGAPISREHVEDIVMFIFQAGLDTVTAGLGHVFHYLATHPEKQRELIADPSLIPNAVEEILRAFPWIGLTRKVRQAVDFHGAPLRVGDVVHTIPYGAGRDPTVHDQPDTVDFHRADTPHFTFGGGVHRCAGSHLARRELRIAVEQWLQRIGEFGIKPGAEIRYMPAGMFQLSALPLAWRT